MRIRSILAGLAISAGALVLSSPAALADTNPQPAAPTSTRATEATTRPAPPSQRPATTTQPPATPEARPAEDGRRPQVVKPVGAAETGAGMEDASSSTGLFVIGGVGLVALAGGGTVALRRMRKQS
jgi:hypothetical protein